MKKIKAFTLAETLITLAIIGVVAALTIPTVIKNYQKNQTVKRLKVGYQMLQEAMNRAIVDHGPTKNWYFGTSDFGTTKPYIFLNTYLAPYLRVQRQCGYKTKFDSKNCKGIKDEYGLSSVILANSMVLYVRADTGTNGMEVQLDINGKKGPFKAGKDLFIFNISSGSNKIRPRTPSTWSNGSDNCVKDYHGNTPAWQNWSCAYKIIRDGWQIKDDYPW